MTETEIKHLRDLLRSDGGLPWDRTDAEVARAAAVAALPALLDEVEKLKAELNGVRKLLHGGGGFWSPGEREPGWTVLDELAAARAALAVKATK